jgi:hypothetical protein
LDVTISKVKIKMPPTNPRRILCHLALAAAWALVIGALASRHAGLTLSAPDTYAAPPAQSSLEHTTYLPLVFGPPPGGVRAYTTTLTIQAHDYVPALETRYNSTYNMPYLYLNRGRYDPGRMVLRTFTLVVIENDYLRLSFLPELGGRLYQAIYKPTGHNLFYQNPVLKPSPWGPPEMGWWLAAGGMEWCLPVEEHGYEWGVPWQYSLEGAGGNLSASSAITMTVWDTPAADRLRARVSVSLFDREARFHVQPAIENPTAQPIDYKFWLNAMLAPGGTPFPDPGDRDGIRDGRKPGGDLRIVLPTTQVTVHSSGDPRLPGDYQPANWPVHNGVDWSRLGNWREWYGFFQRPQAGGDFQGVYDESADEGVVRAYPGASAWGAKFFAFGYGAYAIPPGEYTDDGSAYVEIHGGAAPTFADNRRLEPGQSLAWREQWYPVSGIGSLTWANPNLALRAEPAPGQMRLHLATAAVQKDVEIRMLRRGDGLTLFSQSLAEWRPDAPYHSPWISTPGLGLGDVAVRVTVGGAQVAAWQ